MRFSRSLATALTLGLSLATMGTAANAAPPPTTAASAVALTIQHCNAGETYQYPNGQQLYFPVYKGNGIYTRSCLLTQGDKGIAVRFLQRAMNKCHGQNIEEDGDFGPRTLAALKATQARHAPRIEVGDTYGPRTGRTIGWATSTSMVTGADSYKHCQMIGI